jgi:hypothetical protein
MSKARRSGLFALILLLVAVAGPAQATGIFIDDDGNPHEANIEIIATAGITEGCNPPANDRYCPTNPVTRGQMAAFLRRAYDIPASTFDAFDDDDGSIFEADINAISATGITTGCATRLFCEDGLVTREQIAAFLVRALSLPPAQTGDQFSDDDDSQFEAEIDSLAEAGITTGCGASTFCPKQTVLRDQMATFLARSLGPTSAGGCTLVVGFSQTKDWFTEGTFEHILLDNQWELLWEGSSAIQQWADPGYSGWRNQVLSACTTGEPDRLLLTISGEGRPVEEWVAAIQAAVTTARAKFPSVEEVVLQPVVGGPNNSLCAINGETVRASSNHPVIDQAIAQITSGTVGIRTGFSPEVRTCADYGDALGHLVDSANGPVGDSIASFYLAFE